MNNYASLYQNMTTKYKKGLSYKTLRRDSEAEMPNIFLDIVRVSPDGRTIEEKGVSSMKQNCVNRKSMVTAYVKV